MRTRFALFYVVLLALSAAGIAAALDFGMQYFAAADIAAAPAASSQPHAALGPLGVLLLQIIVIIGAVKLIGPLQRWSRQPPVIGEMVAGILLGPSLLGLLWPDSQQVLFPTASLGALGALSQLGVILFMFFVGAELDIGTLRRQTRTALAVSHASIAVPFLLSIVLSVFIYPLLAPAAVPFLAFALFMGTAMSVTAFPVLARIVAERGLAGTAVGNSAIACAAIDDITAWCLLAAAVAIALAQGIGGTLITIALTVSFVVFMLFAVQPLAARRLQRQPRTEAQQRKLLATALLLVLLSALCTELIGIHALFGAFLAGVILPRQDWLRALLVKRVESFCSSLLLPVFFAFTGLRTEIGLLQDAHSWLLCLGIIAVAIAGKLGGSLIAARCTGNSWEHGFALGILMNTRGLMELIVLNIGYDLGIISPKLFTMLVIMALVTTCMTGPLLSLVEQVTHKNLRGHRVPIAN